MAHYSAARRPANALTVGIFCSPQVSPCWPRHSVSCFIWDHTDFQIPLMLLYSLTWSRCWKMIYPPFKSTLKQLFCCPLSFFLAFLGWALTQFTDTDPHTCAEPCPHIWDHLWNLLLVLFDGHNASMISWAVMRFKSCSFFRAVYSDIFLLYFLLHTVHTVSV